MYHQLSGQYHSDVSNPTVTLGNQYQSQNIHIEGSNYIREQIPQTIRNQQHPSNLKFQYEREIQNCNTQIQALKEQIWAQQQQKVVLEDTIYRLKEQRKAVDRQNQELFRQNERNTKLIQKLKIDNQSKEMQIQKFRGEKKLFYKNTNTLEIMRRQMTQQVNQKINIIDELNSKLRRIQIQHSQCQFRIEQFQRIVRQSDKQIRELTQEHKITLEKCLTQGNMLNHLDYQIKQANQLNKNMRNRIYELQENKKELLNKLGFSPSAYKEGFDESGRSQYPIHQKLMVDIQSFMNEIGNVLDNKKQEMSKKRKNHDELRYSLARLEQNL